MTDLPTGAAPAPVPLPHFPDRLHVFVWRNWTLVPLERLARVVGAAPEQIRDLGHAMGLPDPPAIPPEQEPRSALTVIRRNWHLLPYEQLLPLLEWAPEALARALREDDFLFIKLGGLKPDTPPLRYAPPDAAARARAAAIARLMRETFPEGAGRSQEPLFAFIKELSSATYPPWPPLPTGEGGKAVSEAPPSPVGRGAGGGGPRFLYSYFALYGDPLLEPEADPFPVGYLSRLAALGVNGVWLHGVLSELAPFPWDPARSARCEERRKALRELVERAERQGIGVYLYLNEPRMLPLSFFAAHPELRGVVMGDHAALCTSVPEVRDYLAEAVAAVCRAAPGLAGIFTITASENPTHCGSHGRGGGCPRCAERSAGALFAEVNGCVHEGIRRAGSDTRLIAWDWGWPEDAAAEAIARLPEDAWLMSVSEWDLPIERGGVASRVGEYALSAIGPGPRARRHWELARRRGLKTVAKIQASNTWEISTVPYIPVVETVARHAAALRAESVDGVMLGWTLGGYPSPNLEVVAAVEEGRGAEEAMTRVARRRFGERLAPAVVAAWRACSAAFAEYPYHINVVYKAPVQLGPANLLWEAPTGYRATMVGFPYDDLDAWRAIYPPEVFIAQMERVAEGFEQAMAELARAARARGARLQRAACSVQRAASRPQNGARCTLHAAPERSDIAAELRVGTAVALHCRSVANQARFILARRALAEAATAGAAEAAIATLEALLGAEIALAARLHDLQARDSRLGFEASNQYAYIPMDLAEKVLNARDLLDRWLPAERRRWQRGG